MAEFVGHFVPGTAEWAAARANAVGGSEVSAVLGLSPFESRFSLWHRKRGVVGPVEDTPEMEWGRRLEPVILDKFTESHPELHDYMRPVGTYRHPDRPWQIACPDMLIPSALVEAKFSVMGDGWGETGTDEIPVYYRTQVLWYLDTFGFRHGHVCVLIGGHDYREYLIERDDNECALLREHVEQFLTEVALDHRPDIDNHAATYQVIREMHPDIEPAEVVISNDVARAYIVAKAAEKLAKADARQATSRLADEMGNAHRATWDGLTIATRQARDGGTPYIVAARGLTDDFPQETAAA